MKLAMSTLVTNYFKLITCKFESATHQKLLAHSIEGLPSGFERSVLNERSALAVSCLMHTVP